MKRSLPNRKVEITGPAGARAAAIQSCGGVVTANRCLGLYPVSPAIRLIVVAMMSVPNV
jgi:hypothetical protein